MCAVGTVQEGRKPEETRIISAFPAGIGQSHSSEPSEDDIFLPPELAEGMEQYVPDLERHVIPCCGHWTQAEQPEELNRLMLEWLRRRFG